MVHLFDLKLLTGIFLWWYVTKGLMLGEHGGSVSSQLAGVKMFDFLRYVVSR